MTNLVTAIRQSILAVKCDSGPRDQMRSFPLALAEEAAAEIERLQQSLNTALADVAFLRDRATPEPTPPHKLYTAYLDDLDEYQGQQWPTNRDNWCVVRVVVNRRAE